MTPFWRAYFSHGWFNHQLEHDEPQTYECNLKNVYFSSRFSYDLWPFEVILVVSRLVSPTEKINHVSAVGVFFGLITLRIFFALRTFRKVEFQNNQENSRQKKMWCFCLQKFFFTHTLSIIQRTWIEKLSEKGTSIGFLRGRGVVIPLILPKVPQSSPPEPLGFPSNTPSPWTPPPEKEPYKNINQETHQCMQPMSSGWSARCEWCDAKVLRLHRLRAEKWTGSRAGHGSTYGLENTLLTKISWCSKPRISRNLETFVFSPVSCGRRTCSPNGMSYLDHQLIEWTLEAWKMWVVVKVKNRDLNPPSRPIWPSSKRRF